MAGLVALDIGPGDHFVAALAQIWEDGNAAMPIDQRLPAGARATLLEPYAANRIVECRLQGAPA